MSKKQLPADLNINSKINDGFEIGSELTIELEKFFSLPAVLALPLKYRAKLDNHARVIYFIEKAINDESEVAATNWALECLFHDCKMLMKGLSIYFDKSFRVTTSQ